VSSWNSVEVVLWLQRRFLDDYAPVFSKNKVTGSDLVTLTAKRLQEMGINDELGRDR